MRGACKAENWLAIEPSHLHTNGMKLKLLMSAVTVCALSVAAQAGVVITLESDGDREVSYYSGGKSAIFADGQLKSMIDLKAGKVFEFNHERRVFSELALERIGPEMTQMVQERLAEMRKSPYYAQIEAFREREMQRRQSITFTSRSLGSREIAGISAEAFAIEEDGTVVGERWISAELRRKIASAGDFDYAKLDQYGEVTRKALEPLLGADPLLKIEAELETKGYLVYQADASGAFGVEVTTRLLSVEEKPVDAKKFVIPAGFTKISFSAFHQLDDDDDDDD